MRSTQTKICVCALLLILDENLFCFCGCGCGATNNFYANILNSAWNAARCEYAADRVSAAEVRFRAAKRAASERANSH